MIKKLSAFFLLLFLPIFAKVENQLIDGILDPPNTTWIVRANFALLKSKDENKEPKKMELRLFNLDDFAYFIRRGTHPKFGFVSYSDLDDLWTEKKEKFHDTSAEAIMVFYLSSLQKQYEHDAFSEISLLLSNPYLNTITNSLTFDVELLSSEDSIPLKGEMIEITLFIN